MATLTTLAPDASAGLPKLAVIGGRLEDNNVPIYQEMHRLSGGRILIFATASSEPEIVGAETLAVFRSHGFDAALAPVHGPAAHAAADDPAVVALVQNYRNVYFTGGNQAYIVDALAPGGEETAVLAAIRAAHLAGGLVAGSSAGAAMMSSTMIIGGTSLDGTVFGVAADPEMPGMLLGAGLGFFRWGIVDQHFIKRGRLGRLVVAMAASGVKQGFGIDENTALFVQGTNSWVTGEYGVFLVDMSRSSFDGHRRTFKDIRLSYLDHGDSFDLARDWAHPGLEKRRVRPSEIAYRAPTRCKRNVFGAYTLYDMLTRLVLGDARTYAADRAVAVAPRAGMAVTIEIERLRGISRALIAPQEAGLRMTALNFKATMAVARVSAARLANVGIKLSRDFGIKPSPASRMMLLGSAPLHNNSPLLDAIATRCQGTVGIIAAASAEPRATAKSHIEALNAHGIEAIDLGITIDTIDRISRNEQLVEQIAALRTILIPGGNQIRLVETLLHRGEETPVLTALARAYAAGGSIIAASGAASALSGFMVAGGNSYESLRFGVSADTGHKGLVIQEGIGLFGAGIVDQNIVSGRRLGRLIVACAEEGVPLGFGICEDTMMLATGQGREIEVIGNRGVILVEIDPAGLTLQGDNFAARGTRLSYALPGDRIDVAKARVLRTQPPTAAFAALQTLVRELAADCGAVFRAEPVQAQHMRMLAPIVMGLTPADDGTAILDIECPRSERA